VKLSAKVAARHRNWFGDGVNAQVAMPLHDPKPEGWQCKPPVRQFAADRPASPTSLTAIGRPPRPAHRRWDRRLTRCRHATMTSPTHLSPSRWSPPLRPGACSSACVGPPTRRRRARIVRGGARLREGVRRGPSPAAIEGRPVSAGPNTMMDAPWRE